MVMTELKKPRETFVLGARRLSQPDRQGRARRARDAAAAAEGRAGQPADAGAGGWSIPTHPLTARVAVNRFWQMYFGTGIVKTQEDFGVQGEPPAHPELLDWLATEFIRTGWDVKRDAAADRDLGDLPAVVEGDAGDCSNSDPENRLLARGPRFRLPAEMIRDNALAASGLLNAEIGGPSVLPYQPKGLWEELAFGDGFSAQAYEQSHGKDLYRRSMYTFWKRTAPPAVAGRRSTRRIARSARPAAR